MLGKVSFETNQIYTRVV